MVDPWVDECFALIDELPPTVTGRERDWLRAVTLRVARQDVTYRCHLCQDTLSRMTVDSRGIAWGGPCMAHQCVAERAARCASAPSPERPRARRGLRAVSDEDETDDDSPPF